MAKTVLLLLLIAASGFAQAKFDVQLAKAFQQQLVSEYKDPAKSPLAQKDLADFHGLGFFPIDSNYFVVARFVRTENEKAFKMKTSGQRTPEYVKYGELHFALNGKALKLNLYRNIELSKKEAYRNHLFLPFSDLTNGKESYIGGRYIDMTIPEGDSVGIDFNQAYNPYCAYSPDYSCPIVPLENDLGVEIRAGVKKFHD